MNGAEDCRRRKDDLTIKADACSLGELDSISTTATELYEMLGKPFQVVTEE